MEQNCPTFQRAVNGNRTHDQIIVHFLFSFFVFCVFQVKERDVNSLKMRLKRVMYELRLYSAWMGRNVIRTGGGTPDTMPKDIRIHMTGTILSLQRHFGDVYFNGMQSFDSDRTAMSVSSSSNASIAQESTANLNDIPATTTANAGIELNMAAMCGLEETTPPTETTATEITATSGNSNATFTTTTANEISTSPMYKCH